MDRQDEVPPPHQQPAVVSRLQTIAICLGAGLGVLLWVLFPEEHYPHVSCGGPPPGSGSDEYCPAGAALFTLGACVFVGAIVALAVEASITRLRSRLRHAAIEGSGGEKQPGA